MNGQYQKILVTIHQEMQVLGQSGHGPAEVPALADLIRSQQA
jgi:hypothetical protein